MLSFLFYTLRFLPTADAHTSTSLHETTREAPGHNRLLNLRYRCLWGDAKHGLNEALLLPNEIHMLLYELQATYRPTVAGLPVANCFIVVSLLGGV